MTDVDAFVDIGKSGSRLHIVDSAGVHGYDGRGVSATQQGDAGLVIAAEVTRMLLAADTTTADHILVGSTVELTPNERETLFAHVRRVSPDSVIAVADDGTLAHARHLNAPGVLLAVGTGVIAVARTPEGRLARFDGWGPLGGDRGSAVDVGRAALREVFRDVDEAKTSSLSAQVQDELGAADLALADAILSDENWPATLSSLAQIVCQLSEDGDRTSAGMLDAAAQELLRTARLAVRAATVAHVVVTGRFGGAPAMRSRLETLFEHEGIELVQPLAPSAVAAATILSGPYAAAFTVRADH